MYNVPVTDVIGAVALTMPMNLVPPYIGHTIGMGASGMQGGPCFLHAAYPLELGQDNSKEKLASLLLLVTKIVVTGFCMWYVEDKVKKLVKNEFVQPTIFS